MSRKLTASKKKPPRLQGMTPYSKKRNESGMITSGKMDEQKKNRIKDWVTFYRLNINYFIEHYMGVKLHFYQRVWVHQMNTSTEFLAVASRAVAKTWLTAVYSIARCILYPGTDIVVASSTKKQAGIIISEKCQNLYDNHPNIRRETKSITANNNNYEMRFKNGSKIWIVVSGESARGNRSNITVLEERRLIPKDIIDSIFTPFSIVRNTPYLMIPEYSKIDELKEEAQTIIITSAYYKSHDWYPEAKKILKKIANGDTDSKAIMFDYPILLKHGIKTQKQMKKEMDSFDDPISFLMEYGNIPYGESANAFFKMDLFRRNIKRSWRPILTEDYLAKRPNKYDIPKRDDEKRVVSVDVAMRGGAQNDNTIISCARLTPTAKGWQTDFVYMESHNGKNAELQGLRIKQIVTEFQADALVLDVAGNGLPLFDFLSGVTKDETRGVEYPGYTVLNSDAIDNKTFEELSGRTLSKSAIPIIFPISATQQLNSQIAVAFKERMKNKLVNFLVDDNEEEEFLIKSGNKDIIDQGAPELRAYLLQPHIQTTLLINESIALDMDLTGAAGLVKLIEPVGFRKDRYSSCSYLNYYVSLLDTELLRDRYSALDDEMAFLAFSRVF